MDVRNLCLGILTLGDATGYEIKKAFQDRLNLLYDASFGSIYPALNKLTEEKLVSCRAETQTKRPDKKVYSITEAGKAAFIKELQKDPLPDKFRSDTLATMIFTHFLSRDQITRMLDEYIQYYEENINALSTGCDLKGSPAEQFLCGFGVAVRSAAINYLKENRHLIEAEAQQVDTAAE
ncbi:PadR family transcriptional regulator [Sneathiella limimaris]|uniref:PadR family transcriptional regulator n=1 Tax=Sneathiella limimaris TaxID=1964213 RepID=UPI00146ECBC4|nr:PadR family transcriptional regulator [Sneathiella limimaris]